MTEKLLAQGEEVFGTARDLSQMNDLKALYGCQLRLASLDMTDTPAIRRVVEEAFKVMPRVDVAVSNAGYGLFGAAEEVTDEQLTHQLATNLVGPIQLVRAVLPHMRQQGGGRIIQLSSLHGQAAFPGSSMYHASKWGIEGFVDSVGQEVAPFNIGCTIVEPGSARTDFRHRSASLPPKIDAYDISPARSSRRLIEDSTSIPPGDPQKMVDIIIASANLNPAPRRIALGSDSFNAMSKQLNERLLLLSSQKDSAYSTDFPSGGA
jgi:NAD(P)-dependent dehydrogenase (short-subunit alcohol dehydrogenase family)